MDDFELLREYADCQSERAFTELVSRHLPLVYGTALRMLRQPSAAQDVAQTVFIQLARQAAKLCPGGSLPGWLYRATQRAALHALRNESRRRERETTAMNLAEQNHDPATVWPQLAPLLDEALGQLKPVEQDAVLLRYFDGRSLNETGRALSLSEAAAQKRVSRALEKMRRFLTRRGVTIASAAVLASALDAGMVAPVPLGLAASISTTAISHAAAATGFSLLSLIAMITSKKIPLGLAAVLILGALTTVIAHNSARPTSAPAAPASSVGQSRPNPVLVARVEAPKLAPAKPKNETAGPPNVPTGIEQRIIDPNAGATTFTDAAASSITTVMTIMDRNGVPVTITTRHNADGTKTATIDGKSMTGPDLPGEVYNGDGTVTITMSDGHVVTRSMTTKMTQHADGTFDIEYFNGTIQRNVNLGPPPPPPPLPPPSP